MVLLIFFFNLFYIFDKVKVVTCISYSIFYLGHVLHSRLLSPSLTFGTFGWTPDQQVYIQSRRGQVYVNNAKILDGDIMALNAAIHVIDTVLFTDDLDLVIPEQKQGTTLQPKCVGTKCVGADVVDVAIHAGIFTTLLKIVTDLGLVDTLRHAEAVTVFAPPDEAFDKLPDGTIESLTPDQAKEIVLRHVVDSKVLAADVATGPVETLGGEVIDLIKTDTGGVQITYEGNTIIVDKADVMASNGVIHIIDKVILPAEEGQILLRKYKS